jgi:multidrug efflux pump subunit AcrB
MPNEKQFDFATIAVILVSIALILCGFYLLNQSFTKKQDPKLASISNSAKSSSSQSSSTDTNAAIAALTNQIASQSTSTQSSSASSETKSSEVSSSSAPSSSSQSSASSVSSATESSKKSDLGQSEAIVKVLAQEGGLYKIEVLDTGYQNGRLWKTGKQFRISSTKPMTVNKEYSLTGISEQNGSTSITLIKER